MSSLQPQSPADEFRARLRESPIKVVEVARFLDGLEEEQRIAAVRGIGRSDQRKLFRAVEGYAPVRLVDLFPADLPDSATVRHYGRNTLPLFTHFEKRFSRLPGEDPRQPAELVGFNFQSLSPITGPGYFTAVEDAAREEVLIDYRRVPTRHPDSWPATRPNDRGFSRLVYAFMVDTLRRVSEHVTIGSAARDGKELGSWFLLCRGG